jgi:putative membrane protein
VPQAPLDRLWVPYCGQAPSPAEWLGRWNFDPWLLLALGLLVVAWHVKAGRREPRSRAVFVAGVGMLVLLFVSPLCALTSALFAARTVHHALLIAVAAPLLAWSMPEDGPWRRMPLAGWTVLHALILWAWHYPPFYAAALSNDALYWLMQMSLLGSAVAFWACIRQASVAAAVAALLATMMQMGLLGALVTFASVPLYAPHFLTTAAWGLSPLEDQQLAGLIMWVPAAALYLVAALLVAHRWLREEDRVAA